MSEDRERGEDLASGLDPDQAIRRRLIGPDEDTGEASEEGAPDRLGRRPRPAQAIDVRRYQRMIAGVGVLLLIALSIYLFARGGGGGGGAPGISPGQRLHTFVAPLALSNLDASANAHPVCDPARPSGRGLNVCDRRATVVTFFALSAGPCVQEVSTLQTLSRETRFRGVQFGAVAINAGHMATGALVRRQHWTIPVAYDESGVIGQLYGVEDCPLIEIARPGGRVARRLLGKYWVGSTHLGNAVAAALSR